MIAARLKRRDDGTLELRAPRVGLWREPPRRGSLVTPGAPLGRIEVLGRLVIVVAPKGAAGIVVEVHDPERTRSAVDFDTVIVRLDPEAAGDVAGAVVAENASTRDGALVFRSPMAGRFYRRPAPDKPFFVDVGDEIGKGHAIGLLEVMKTFNRVTLDGELPNRVKVVAIPVEDGADIGRGDVLLELEPA